MALREFPLLQSIAPWLVQFSGSEEGRMQLRLWQQDPLKRSATDKQTPGRNAQFHLYLASLFLRAGHRVRFEEPDLTIQTEFTAIQLAAKRVLRSNAAIERNFFGAVDQLRPGLGLPIVALDLSNLISPDGTCIVADDSESRARKELERTRPWLSKISQDIADRLELRRKGAPPACMPAALILHWTPVLNMRNGEQAQEWIGTPAHFVAKFSEQTSFSVDLVIATLGH